ncbi:uncharacterized protein EV154DRAFT_482126 [Mucor mucedo]|uniref:uncharacterized protein n=1 Tax=Mucor mucedo TaxID=29922 RepID=UPI00221EA399|nr:uncharacterized protein EV154DRAFT_482126 [Mucor mucedo]KAI7890534.1 hypothetical protein EV154DRAFT_482126 [Mucor mucedo]
MRTDMMLLEYARCTYYVPCLLSLIQRSGLAELFHKTIVTNSYYLRVCPTYATIAIRLEICTHFAREYVNIKEADWLYSCKLWWKRLFQKQMVISSYTINVSITYAAFIVESIPGVVCLLAPKPMFM